MRAALFAPLILLIVVAILTWQAERRYEAMTGRIVHDYAAIAAWQYARRTDIALHEEAMQAFRGIAAGHQRAGRADTLLPPSSILAARSDSGPLLLRRARFAFVYDAGSGQLATAGGPVDDATRARITERLRAIARSARHNAEPHRVVFDSIAGTVLAIPLWLLSAPDTPMRAAYGVVSDAEVLAPRFAAVVGEANLLPATTTHARLGADDLAIRLTRPDGLLIFATSRTPGATAARDTSGLHLSELRATVDIPPHMVDALLVGGAPASRLPTLALMILLAAGLAALGVRQDRRAGELARLRTRFVANVSHELRTPLAQISMFAETLKLARERSETERRQFASIIFTEARRLTTLVESVLRFSRGDTNGNPLSLERTDVRDELESAIAAFAPIAEAAGTTVRLQAASDVTVPLDRAAFRQVVLNLLDNAVKHGGEGTRIDVSASTTGTGARVVVEDSGPGVPPEWRERVFEPFARIERRNSGGAGIGLAVVRDLVAAHGGTISIDESTLGGARFTVTLPISPVVEVTERVHA